MSLDPSSPNHNARPPGCAVDMLLLHYTGMQSARAALDRLCDGGSEVSAHYVIDEAGEIFALVPEGRRAWHAGVSCWAGTRDINGCSIGIELVNPGHEFGYRPFPPAQMGALTKLCLDILGRHAIAPHRVLGHADVAPARRQDPGELFDWAGMAAAGIGLWPEIKADHGNIRLEDFGYDVAGAGIEACVTAFQRHWRPEKIDGRMDAECRGRLAGLLDQIA